MFEDIIGQEKIKHFFENAINSGRLSHAYLFYGIEGTGKVAAAFEIAKWLNCQGDAEKPCNKCKSCIKINKMEHPDVDYIMPVFIRKSENKKPEQIAEEIYLKKREKVESPYKRVTFEGNTSISIDTIRDVKSSSVFKPFEGKKKVVIISNAEKMTLDAANSILKLLEEPPKDLIFILTATDLGMIIPTIKSRCTKIKFSPLSNDEIMFSLIKYFNINDKESEIIANISTGSYTKALEYLQEGIEEENEFAEKLLEIILLKDSKIYLDYAEELSNRKNLKFVKDVLTIINLWIKDAIHYKITEAEKTDIINNPIINQLSDNLYFEELELVNNEIEKSIDLINKNIYLYLIIINLVINVRKILNKRISNE